MPVNVLKTMVENKYISIEKFEKIGSVKVLSSRGRKPKDTNKDASSTIVFRAQDNIAASWGSSKYGYVLKQYGMENHTKDYPLLSVKDQLCTRVILQ